MNLSLKKSPDLNESIKAGQYVTFGLTYTPANTQHRCIHTIALSNLSNLTAVSLCNL